MQIPTIDQMDVIGIPLSITSYAAVNKLVLAWSAELQSRFICFANVHMLIEARRKLEIREALRRADLINPDGVPLVWTLRALGAKASRVYGPDCMVSLLQTCHTHRIPIGLYGGSEGTSSKLGALISRDWPDIPVVYRCSPPFREQSAEEEAVVIQDLKASGARVIFIGLGCPKQELWIAKRREQIPAVMLAVGAAFDFLAGTKPQAPRWMMRSGLEWLFRLATEPRRLFARYLQTNPHFIFLALIQILSNRFSSVPKSN